MISRGLQPSSFLSYINFQRILKNAAQQGRHLRRKIRLHQCWASCYDGLIIKVDDSVRFSKGEIAHLPTGVWSGHCLHLPGTDTDREELSYTAWEEVLIHLKGGRFSSSTCPEVAEKLYSMRVSQCSLLIGQQLLQNDPD